MNPDASRTECSSFRNAMVPVVAAVSTLSPSQGYNLLDPTGQPLIQN